MHPISSVGASRSRLALLLLLFAPACTLGPREGAREPLVERQRVSEATSPFGMVATSSREATEAAVAILESGGNAMDAAVAAAFTLGASDPSTSGLGGMTHVLFRRADGTAAAIDGSALQPALIERARLRAREGNLPDPEETAGFEFVAVPTTLQTLAYAARAYGTRPLADLIAPAIAVAEHGYVINYSKRGSIEKYLEVIRASETLRSRILRNGIDPPESGDRFCNPELAKVLRAIAEEGPEAFTAGWIAREIEADMIRHGGFVRRSDLAAVEPVERAPLATSYRGVDVLSFPAPGTGAVLVEALNILEQFRPEELTVDGAERIRTFAEMNHVALEDNASYIGNPQLGGASTVPEQLSKAFAAHRAQLIRSGRRLSSEDLAAPPGLMTPGGGTTHVSVVDSAGNAVALTQTLGRFYGAKVLTPSLGFPYNSLLEGLSSRQLDRLPRRFRIPASLAPAILVKNGFPFLVLGASGSAKSPGNLALTISNIVDREMPAKDAIAAPRILWDSHRVGQEILLEVVPPQTRSIVDALRAMGYDNLRTVEYPTPPRSLSTFGGVNLVEFDLERGLFVGVADPRRGGYAAGPGI